MLLANELPRKFLFNNDGIDIDLPDPQSGFSPDTVLNFYAPTYPILTTAKIEGPEIRNDYVQYKFVTTIGTKG